MVTLDQIKLLETRISRALDIVNRVTEEKNRVIEENSFLKNKLETYQKRIDELEVMIGLFKEDQTRIEEGIVALLERLGRFEEAIENSAAKQPSPAGTAQSASSGGAASAGSGGQAKKADSSASRAGEKQAVAAYIPADEDGDDALIFDEAVKDTQNENAAGVSPKELDIF